MFDIDDIIKSINYKKMTQEEFKAIQKEVEESPEIKQLKEEITEKRAILKALES